MTSVSSVFCIFNLKFTGHPVLPGLQSTDWQSGDTPLSKSGGVLSRKTEEPQKLCLQIVSKRIVGKTAKPLVNLHAKTYLLANSTNTS